METDSQKEKCEKKETLLASLLAVSFFFRFFAVLFSAILYRKFANSSYYESKPSSAKRGVWVGTGAHFLFQFVVLGTILYFFVRNMIKITKLQKNEQQKDCKKGKKAINENKGLFYPMIVLGIALPLLSIFLTMTITKGFYSPYKYLVMGSSVTSMTFLAAQIGVLFSS